LKEEALDRIKWRTRFGRGCGPVVWQITDDDDDEWWDIQLTGPKVFCHNSLEHCQQRLEGSSNSLYWQVWQITINYTKCHLWNPWD
jgi:hypothetical protein